MSLNNEKVEEIVSDEDSRWRSTHKAIVTEMNRANTDMCSDRKLARELTSEMVAAKRDEDKAQIASDEAVAHGLSKLRENIKDDFDALAKQPYFARVITSENNRNVEFRLGTASFPAQRIVDWRKAPISQLYYNYQEGEDFAEVIQDRDREGVIKLRRSYQGVEDQLNTIELSEGIIKRNKDKWNFEDVKGPLSRASGHDGHLPPILSLITSEQFELITKDAHKPVVIQGIAGSGKTTVALHRLAWLLHEDNSSAKPEKTLVIVFNRALKTYIEETLPELGIEGVVIKTYHQWLNGVVVSIAGPRPYGSFKKTRALDQFKSSKIILSEINSYVSEFQEQHEDGYIQDVYRYFDYLTKKDMFWPKWDTIKEQLKAQVDEKGWAIEDDTILLNLAFAREGYYACNDSKCMHLCDHIVIDEAQDFGVCEIRALINALDSDRTVTIVGDAAQKIVMNRHFGSWHELLEDAGFADTTPVELIVSHRTTKEIMEIAASIRGESADDNSLWKSVRHGPSPQVLKASTYDNQLYIIGKWIADVVKKDPRSLVAVVCRWPKQAERLTEALRKIGYPFVRLAHRDSFDFSPGVNITNVHQVKGLEFRNVLIVNPTEEQYSSLNPEETNLLYVAVTRAEVKLDFTIYGELTKILPDSLLF